MNQATRVLAKRGSTKWQNRDEVLIKHGSFSYFDSTQKKRKRKRNLSDFVRFDYKNQMIMID